MVLTMALSGGYGDGHGENSVGVGADIQVENRNDVCELVFDGDSDGILIEPPCRKPRKPDSGSDVGLGQRRHSWTAKMINVQSVRYSGRAKEDLAFRVDHKLRQRSKGLGGRSILGEKDPEVICQRSFLQELAFHSREAPGGLWPKVSEEGGPVDALRRDTKPLGGHLHQLTEDKLRIWGRDVPTVPTSNEDGWRM